MPLPVSGVMPVQDPDLENFRRTVASIYALDPGPAELVIVDSSPGDPVTIGRHERVDLRIVHRPEWADRGRTIPLQRRTGALAASQPVIWRLDEDAVFEDADHLGVLMETLSEPGVVAACSRFAPLERSPIWSAYATALQVHPSAGLFPVYRAADFPPEDAYPHDTTDPFSPYAEDVIFADGLMARGKIVRCDDLVARTTIPTTRSRRVARVIGAAAVGAALLGGG